MNFDWNQPASPEFVIYSMIIAALVVAALGYYEINKPENKEEN